MSPCHILKTLPSGPRVAIYSDDSESVVVARVAIRAVTWQRGVGSKVRDLLEAEGGALVTAQEAPGRVPGLPGSLRLLGVLPEREFAWAAREPEALEPEAIEPEAPVVYAREGPSVGEALDRLVARCSALWRKCLEDAERQEELEASAPTMPLATLPAPAEPPERIPPGQSLSQTREQPQTPGEPLG